jgi:hypothetical protein
MCRGSCIPCRRSLGGERSEVVAAALSISLQPGGARYRKRLRTRPLTSRRSRLALSGLFEWAGTPLICDFVEPMTGIEPAYSAWEADVLPLNYIGLGDSDLRIRSRFALRGMSMSRSVLQRVRGDAQGVVLRVSIQPHGQGRIVVPDVRGNDGGRHPSKCIKVAAVCQAPCSFRCRIPLRARASRQ